MLLQTDFQCTFPTIAVAPAASMMMAAFVLVHQMASSTNSFSNIYTVNMNDDITVSRDYFVALLRRAERGEQERLQNSITIAFDEYIKLQQACKEYTALKHALVEAGTPIESIQILINAHTGAFKSKTEDYNFIPTKVPGRDDSAKRSWSRAPIFPPGLMQRKAWRPDESEPTTPTTADTDSAGSTTTDEVEIVPKPNYVDCNENRSVIIRGVPKRTTLEDVCKVIRGGAILNMYRQQNDHTIQLAFTEPLDATDFIRNVKRNDFYIQGKRVEVVWSDRNYYVKGGLAYQIKKQGATRNLVIRFHRSGVTEDIIRDDLEHIHLLEIVSLRLENGYAWISLNGIQHAITARNCMSSRLRYKGSSIQFWPDECAEPWQIVAEPPIKTWKPTHQAKISAVSANRFDGLLECKDGETSSESGSDA